MRVVLELTDRCNLRCAHCFEGRHGGRGWLALPVLDSVLAHAAEFGIDEFALTGGEPTLHPEFATILERMSAAGVSFGLVTNGWNFPRVCPDLLAHRAQLRGLTFSMDGATEATHDGIRGRGSRHRLLQAMSLCVVRRLPFAVNMVLTRSNVHEIEALVELAAAVRADGVRFGHLIPTPRSVDNGLYLTHEERTAVDARIRELAGRSPLPVALAPGYRTSELFPCEPLNGNEINIDWRGRLTRCCHLSGQTHAGTGDEVIGSLRETPFPDLMRRLAASTAAFRREKSRQFGEAGRREEDYFPCDYCLKRFDKVTEFRQGTVRFPIRVEAAGRNTGTDA